MSFFEIPSWDGDLKIDKLAAGLFCQLNVPVAKLSKKRKKSKLSKDSLADKLPKTLKSSKERKAAAKKNIACTILPKHKDKGQVKLNGNPMEKIKHNSSESSSVENNFSLSNSALNSTLSSNLPVKCKKKNKRQKQSNLEGDIKKSTVDHKLKSLQGKLDLYLIDSIKESSEGGSIANQDLKHKREGKQKNEMLGHTVKNLKNKLVHLKHDQQPEKQLNHLAEKESKTHLSPKKKMKERSHLSQSINPKKRKQSLVGESCNIKSSPDCSQKGTFNDGSKSKMLEKKRKKGSTVKQMIASNDENGKKRIKKMRLIGEAGSQADELAFPSTNMEAEQARDLDYVDGSREPNGFQSSGTIASPKKKLTLREKMMEKLRGSRFRFMNEQLYTSKSEETRKFFESDMESFEAYHEGYKQQLLQWPLKPVDLIIKYLKKKPANYIIADFGCGDAQIAQSLPNQVHSFDFVALNKRVTACDMAHTPLSKGSVDVAVFCLSLMGSNLSDYIYEANRVLKIGGIMKIAEVESRFDNVENFIRVICKFGFLCISRDLSRDVFYLFDFKKEKNLKKEKILPRIELRPCTYKKR